MSVPHRAVFAIPNGPGAAAVLAAGIGCFALALLAFAGEVRFS